MLGRHYRGDDGGPLECHDYVRGRGCGCDHLYGCGRSRYAIVSGTLKLERKMVFVEV